MLFANRHLLWTQMCRILSFILVCAAIISESEFAQHDSQMQIMRKFSHGIEFIDSNRGSIYCIVWIHYTDRCLMHKIYKPVHCPEYRTESYRETSVFCTAFRTVFCRWRCILHIFGTNLYSFSSLTIPKSIIIHVLFFGIDDFCNHDYRCDHDERDDHWNHDDHELLIIIVITRRVILLACFWRCLSSSWSSQSLWSPWHMKSSCADVQLFAWFIFPCKSQ